MAQHNFTGPSDGQRPPSPVNPPAPSAVIINPPPHHQDPPPSFWQHHFAQHTLPFLTSLALHLGLILAAVLTVRAIQVVITAPTTQPYAFDLNFETNSSAPTVDSLQPRGTEDGDIWAILPPTQNRTPGIHSGYAQDVGDGQSALALKQGGGDSELKLPASLIAIGGRMPGDGQAFGPGSSRGTSLTGGPGGEVLAPFGPQAILAPKGTTTRPPDHPTFIIRGARSVVFVCDASGSMLNNFDGLRIELQNAVNGLHPVQMYNVVLFQDRTFMAIERGQLMPATPANKRKAADFLGNVSPRGSTDPIPALELALRQKPELVYLLTDGDFADNDAVLAFIRQRAKGCRINTIAFINRGEQYERVLQTIAKETGGMFKYVGEEHLSGK